MALEVVTAGCRFVLVAVEREVDFEVAAVVAVLLALVVVVLRVEVALGVRFTVFFDVVDLLFVTVVGLREDVLRAVVAGFD